MQHGGDLESAWMMFNHVKRVKGWTTMACHVYGLIYCKIMTLVVCDMKLKSTKPQCVLWMKLNKVMLNQNKT
jgi:hypothetical protein